MDFNLKQYFGLLVLSIFISLSSINNSTCQSSIVQENLDSNAAKVIEKYEREYPDGFSKLNAIITDWTDQGLQEKQARIILEKISGSQYYQNQDLISVKKHFDAKLKMYGVQSDLRLLDIIFIQKSAEVVRLYYMTAIDLKNPQSSSIREPLAEKILAFDVHDEMKVLEIGGGLGHLAILMGMAYDNIKYTLNEIDTHASYTAQNYIQRFQNSGLQDDNYYFTIGTKNATNAFGIYDRIIMVNTLHHLERSKMMLHSIKDCMNDKSILVIKEEVKDNTIEKDCKDRISCKEIEKRMKKSKFTLISKQKSGSRVYIYHYKK